MTVYFNQMSLQPAAGSTATEQTEERLAKRPFRSQKQAANEMKRRKKQRQQRVRAY